MSRDALIVGINTYKSQNLSNLQAPAEDAEAIAKLLEQYSDFKVIRGLPEAIDKETQQPYVAKKIEVSFTDIYDLRLHAHPV